MIQKLVKNSIKSNPLYWGAAPFLKLAMKSVKKKTDYDEFGGAPLLGVNGTCIIGHGKSNSRAVKNALNVAARLAKSNVNKIIEEQIQKFKDVTIDK